ncbi:hypothetical protein ACFSO7_20795 [Bacillus sp. CGMCC 1.16607]
MNQIIHGDCLEIMPKLPSKSFDMILCSNNAGLSKQKSKGVTLFEKSI